MLRSWTKHSVISEVFLSIGSNLGHRLENLQNAVDSLGRIMAVEALAPVYETAPWGVEDQPDFYNSCVKGRTRLGPEAFLLACKEIEAELGREKRERWGPRVIDIDILYFGKIEISTAEIRIPHPEIAKRAFVLVPLADINQSLRDPVKGHTVAEMLAEIDISGVELAKPEERYLRRPVNLAWGIKTFIMAILNVTPDSFSGDGIVRSKEVIQSAVDQARRFSRDGADIIDIGGESTRPGSTPVSQKEELERILPVIAAVRAAVDLPISIDTYRSKVASSALDAGADWINDVWGLKMDEDMSMVAAEYDCPIVIMHNRSKPKDAVQEEKLGGRYRGVVYKNLMEDISEELVESIATALEAGVRQSKIIADPGVGFGKTVSHNLQLLNRLDKLADLGCPICVGPSRKSFIGYTLDLPVENRLEGTSAAVAISIARGANIIRIHDVKEMVRVARMTDSILGA